MSYRFTKILLYVIIIFKINIYSVNLYLFSNPSSAEWQRINSIGNAVSGQVMISDSEFFFLSYELTSPYNAYFLKLTFEGSKTDWINKLVCSTGACSYTNILAGSIKSEDGSKIYSIFPFGTTQYLYLAIWLIYNWINLSIKRFI